MKKAFLIILALVPLVIFGLTTMPGTVHAVPLFFFGEDVNAGGSLPVPNSVAAQTDFLSNLVGVSVEDFESFTVGDTFPLNVAFDGDTATLNGTSNVSNTGIQNTGIAGRFAISGEQYLNVGTTDAANFNLTFSSAQAAFGFFATDIGDFGGQLTVSLDGGPDIVVPHMVNSPNGAALFWGIIDVDNLFTTVSFSNTTGSLADAFGFDDFTIGRREQVQVPEPATLLLIGTGLVGLAAFSRRRFKK